MAAFSEREAEVYDRQIRLWGVEAQRRMKESRILVVGLGALQAELCKNLALAGMNLVLLDPRPVAEAELGSNLFVVEPEAVGLPRASVALPLVRDLNPLVSIELASSPVLPPASDEAFWSGVQLVCAGGIARQAQLHLAAVCRARRLPLFLSETAGWFAHCVIDLGERHTFTTTVTKAVAASSSDASAGGSGGGAEEGATVAATEERTVSFPAAHAALDGSWERVPTRSSHPGFFLAATLDRLDARTRRAAREPGDVADGSRVPVASAVSVEVAVDDGTEEGVNGVVLGDTRARVTEPAVLEALVAEVRAELVRRGAAEHWDEAMVRSLASTAGLEFGPLCAVAGGLIGQEVVKAISLRDAPTCNVLCVDGRASSATGFRVPVAP